LIVHHAAWLLPIAGPPIRGGWVAVEAGRIVSAGGADAPPRGASRRHESHAILPGLVNAHTHLELSWMSGRVPPGTSMPDWTARLIALGRRGDPGPVVEAIGSMHRSGTVLVGDIGNTPLACEPLSRGPLSGCVFREVLGFNAADPSRMVASAASDLEKLRGMGSLRGSVVPHAPYSVSPALFREIARTSREEIVSVHVAESCAEIEFLHTGTGPWRDVLDRLGAWDSAWTPPACGPVAYLDGLGLINDRLLAVHGVHLTDAELGRLAQAGATVVTCPRSNRWTGAGIPPIPRFYASGVRVAVGTDSLASVEDLNLLSELAVMRALAPDVPAARLLDSVTRSGAEALGFGGEYGTIEPGKRAELIAVRVPPDVEDVEEYLVSGISPDHIGWLAQG
jgi:cytosine/adenosine deaminase-related metal-dependent hydrolase